MTAVWCGFAKLCLWFVVLQYLDLLKVSTLQRHPQVLGLQPDMLRYGANSCEVSERFTWLTQFPVLFHMLAKTTI